MNTGIIGLGAMGAGMARNLHRAGFLRAVYNRSPHKAEILAERFRVQRAETPQELAGQCALILMSLPRDQDVLERVAQLCERLRPDTIVVDTSTVSSTAARAAAAAVEAAGGHFLDCPVSGGSEGARQGQLVVMAGGEAAVLERCRPVLSAIAKSIVHIGPVGCGQAAKAVNQIMAAGINQAVTEALAFGQALDLDMDRVLEVVAGGAAGNWFLDHRGRSMLAEQFAPGFRLSLHHKDLEICEQMLRDAGKTPDALPVSSMTRRHYRQLMEQGHGDEDISALFRSKQAALK